MLNATGEVEAVPEDRVAFLLPHDLIRDDEIIILLIRPSALWIVLGALGSLASILIFTLFIALLAAKINWVPWAEEQAWALGATLVAGRLAWQGLEWFNRVYVLTDRRVITRSGVLRVRVFEARLNCIQHTTVIRRLRERLCGLGSVGFATAGSDVFETFWLSLRQPFHIHRIITEAIQRYGRP